MSKRKDSIAGVLLICLSTFLLYKAFLLPKSPTPGHPGPGLFPKIILSAILLASLYLIYQGLRKDSKSPSEKKGPQSSDIQKTIFILSISFVYIFLMGKAHFILITFLFLVVSMQALKNGPFPSVLAQKTKLAQIVLVSSLVSTGIYFIFGVFLYIPLP